MRDAIPASRKPPRKSDKPFHVVEIEGYYFWAHAQDDLYLNSEGQVVLGNAVAIFNEGTRWAICKYGPGEPRIDITGLSADGRTTLAREFGIPVDNEPDDTGALFYASPAFAGLVEWVAAHPRAAKNQGDSAYLPGWHDLACARVPTKPQGVSMSSKPKPKAVRSAASSVKDALGYVDRGIGTRAHDAHLFWLEENLKPVLEALVPRSPWTKQEIEDARTAAADYHLALLKLIDSGRTDASPMAVRDAREWKGLGDTPSWGLNIRTPVLQYAISANWHLHGWTNRRGATVCYADLAVTVDWLVSLKDRNWLAMGKSVSFYGQTPSWGHENAAIDFRFLVETEIEGYAELIQRVRAYKQHDPNGRYVIVCPDDTFASSFRRQGIGFVKCPPHLHSAASPKAT